MTQRMHFPRTSYKSMMRAVLSLLFLAAVSRADGPPANNECQNIEDETSCVGTLDSNG